MLSILAGILLLGICVFFHELGHFLIGKLAGVRPRVFSIGYGRGLFFRRRKGTIYQITAIPLGGYVQFYGDDPSQQNRKMRKGDFFSVGPWRRMALAFGGPLFSVLLGFLVVLFLLQTGYRPMDNTVRVDTKSALYKAGLRDGDRVVQVDGAKTPSFDRIIYEFGFAHSDTVDVTVERNSVPVPLRLPVVRSEPGTPGMFTGARPLSRLTMTEAGPKGTGLNKGDEILQANGVELFSIEDLIRVLNDKPADSAELLVHRHEGGAAKQLTLTVPLKKVPRIILKNLRDVQTGKNLPEIVIEEGAGNEFQNIFINGESFRTFAEFRAALENSETTPKLRAGPVEISGTIEPGFRRQIGIRPAEKAISSLSEMSFVSKIILSFDETVFITKSTLVGLGRIIEGKLSFNKSVSGPVKMVAIAAKTVELGWQTYFLLMAQITIILGVMNLLPIPVLDGGHIIFYLIEAIYKPVSFKVQATATRIGMALMLAMGIYVIGLDIIDVFFRRVFG
ncbi:MAG TPA: site-2 protease family protein [Turneriella sp.]|nr:site-2 protease family protein [Turneriella sp.]HNJ64680.1 site-2 protease family protein [Turneriella sp.]HNL10622.1 site-2 protease family protein [Turneriella sp.]HNL53835.1 site-2 protease family protein [Turneriella sp.]HNN00182.1 site-2 protease family protein [Turneriella sp.]